MHRLGQWAHRRRLVPAPAARPGHGHPPDGTTPGRGCRRGDDRRGRRAGQRLRRALDPRGRHRSRGSGRRGAGHRPAPPGADRCVDRQPLPRRQLPGPGARRLGAARRPAVPGVDLLADLARAGPPLVGCRGRGADRRHARAGSAGSDRRRQLSDIVGSRVRPLRWVAIAAARDHGAARSDRAVRGRGGPDGGRLDGHGGRQRAGVHQRCGAGRLLLVGSRARHPEHGAVPHCRRRGAGRRHRDHALGVRRDVRPAALCPVVALPLVPRDDGTSAERKR